MSGQLSSYLILSTALLAIGLYGVLCRRNIIAILISVEFILNAANINFLAFNHFLLNDAWGPVFVLFVIALAAAEICVALSLVILITKRTGSLLIDDAKTLKG